MISIPYNVHIDINSGDDEYDYESEYLYNLNIKDIITYEYENKYNETYNEMSWWLLPNAKEFVKKLEDDWLNNRIDEFKYKNDFKFIKRLKDIYHKEILKQEEDNLDLIDFEDLEYDEDEEEYIYDDKVFNSKLEFIDELVEIIIV